ncbi:MAG: general secretion pathway protein GspB [Methylococcales bacterium]|nr:general secretion pathway protein GspB [Methylococcales bacterium]
MSYILNALRKSEQERLAQQPDTVTGRILVSQPQPRHKASKLIILLMITNLIFVAAFFWFARREPDVPSPNNIQKTSVPEKIQVKPGVVPQVKMDVVPEKPTVKKSEPASPSIAELAASKKAPLSPLPAPRAAVEKQPVPAQLKTDQARMEKESEPVAIAPVEPVQIVEKKPEAVAVNKSVPFLFELPAEFRHNVPELKINVFVYSEQPAERFVMVDMVKYTVGGRIKELLTLKEIRPDSLVVEYNNQTFQIKRP